jgi:D-alanyl-lipoteichoic acid acyltransferase DltB (MBOAT superfamily)
MQFNSFTFLGFFAVLVAIYYALPPRLRWPLLLVASYYFYSQFRLGYVLLLAYSTLAAYGFGLLLEGGKEKPGARKLLAFAVIAQLIVLVVFKYVDFLSDTLASALGPVMRPGNALVLPRLGWLLPAGLSFFVFSAISYVMDVYRGVIRAEHHLGRLGLYIAFFPKLVAGPIERAGPFLAQVNAGVRFALPTFVFGLQLLLWGLFKKVVIADRLADFVNAGFTDPSFQSPIALVIAVYSYAFQIYCDFSGYSDMAIGLAAILGYQLMENFRRPYFSRSVAEFWSQRWHISLMRWFRDYLYIPLGGNRVSRPRWYANQMIVFLISGLWHGANLTFVIWGGLNGLYQVVYYMLGGVRKAVAARLPSILWDALGLLLTFHLVLVSWIFFRAESVGQAWIIISRIWASLPILPMLIDVYSGGAPLRIAVGLIVVLLLVELVDEFCGLWSWLARRPIGLRWAFYYALLACLIVLGQWGMSKFVYMQF